MSNRGRIYWPKCAVCQYIKKNPEFKAQVMESNYFNPEARESLAEVIHRWGDPFKMPTVYSHMQRHQSKQTRDIELTAPTSAVPIVELEGEVISSTAYERGLDEIIAKGRQAVRDGVLKVNGNMLNTAIKTKAEIEKSTKDRRLDAFKMMSGAFSGNTNTSEPSKSDSEG